MKQATAIAAFLGVIALAALAAVTALGPEDGTASSHREAPLISEDPTADLTDVYAFRSPDKPNTVTILANVIPGEDPAAGPNYYTFSPNARYNLKIDTDGDVQPNLIYRFQFGRKTGQFFLGDTSQPYTVTRSERGRTSVVARGTTPPNNIGPRSTPNYRSLVSKSILSFDGGRSQAFAGQRDDPFFGDIGAIFDLVAIRKGTGSTGGGKDFFAGYGVHTIGIWTAVDRQVANVNGKGDKWVQVSRLGNPLINEVVIPTTQKDLWNRLTPADDERFVKYYRTPLLAAVINKLYKLGVPETDRDDLVQVLLTGIPNVTFTGKNPADELRINLSTPVTPAGKQSRLGVLGGDNQGFPNGRRLNDDVIDIAEQAVGGFLVGKKLPLGDGVDTNDVPSLSTFPYQADPASGFANTKGLQKP